MKSYEDVAFMFTAESSSVLPRSWTGISYLMATLLKDENELQPYVQAGILGAGVASLVDQLSEMDSDFGTLNTFSDGADRRTEEEHLEAIQSTAKYFAQTHCKPDCQPLTLSWRQAGVRLLYYSQRLAELMSFWSADALNTSQAIPTTQTSSSDCSSDELR